MEKPSSSIKFFGHNNDEWIGIVLPYDSQEEQSTGSKGWGLRYKVAIMGYHSSEPGELTDSEIGYAMVRLGVTDGTGAAGRMKTVRISQGDVVIGRFLDGSAKQQPIIEGVLGRTSGTKFGKGRFECKTGFVGNLEPRNLIGRHESNEISNPPCVPTSRPGGKGSSGSSKQKSRSIQSELASQIGLDTNSEAKLNEISKPPGNGLTEEEQKEIEEAIKAEKLLAGEEVDGVTFTLS